MFQTVFICYLIICVLGTISAVRDQGNCPQGDQYAWTTNGCVQGLKYDKYRVFEGIPFAQPPVGNLRWASPVPPKPWSPSIYNATTNKPACPQACILPPSLCPPVTSEDCLYLDVYTPVQANPNSKLAVMVFIPGGAYEQGSAFVPVYNGEYIASNTNTILVLLNYRLGALGFMVTDNFDGNYGLKDQILALQWVNANIANFGGDVERITIFGESAGAGSVGVHLISPKSNGLFHGAIMESNPLGLPFKTRDEAISYGKKLASKIGCDSKDDDCLRRVEASSIVAVEDNIFVIPDPFRANLLDIALVFAPVIDNDYVPMQTLQAFSKGNYNRSIPIMMGTNSQEAVMFVYGLLSGLIGTNPLSKVDYDLLITAVFQLDALKVHKQYTCDVNDCRITLSVLLTDFLFTCPTRNLLSSSLTYSNPGQYLYMFNHTLSFDAWGPHFEFCKDACCHGAELPFVFHSAQSRFSPEEDTLSMNMVHYWTNFANSIGNPNKGMSVPVTWPMYSTSSRGSVQFATPSVFSQNNLLSNVCDFWDSLGYSF